MKSTLAIVFACQLCAAAGLADETPIQIGAKELYEVFCENEADFDERFADQEVQISGVVGGVVRSTSLKNGGPLEYTVILLHESEGSPIVMHFNVSVKHRWQIAQFKRDQTVTMKGICRGPAFPEISPNIPPASFLRFDDCEPVIK